MQQNSTDLPHEILAFWFGADASAEAVSAEIEDMWFKNGPAYDAVVRERFGGYIEAAVAGAFDAWCKTPQGRLALVIVLDQMPRHVYRGTVRAFSADAKAREVCLAGLEAGDDRQMTPIQRVVFYLPMEHAEDLALQERLVQLYDTLATEVSEGARDQYEMYAKYGWAHRDIVARFGHFPHRSALIGRPLTQAEEAFLLEPGSSF